MQGACTTERTSPGPARRLAAGLTALGVVLLVRLITAVRAVWRGVEPVPEQRIYFANHASHGDFALIWTVLPPPLRRRTRPVAAADYWLGSRLRRFIIRDVFNGVVIDREGVGRGNDPVRVMTEALDDGASLIVFPEGTRNSGTELLPFRSGIYRLAKARPEVPLVPVHIENLNRVLPKGSLVPVPLLCTVAFGEELRIAPGEAKQAFLARASAALRAAGPESHRTGESPGGPNE